MGRKVLIVDDSGSLRTLVRLALQQAGFETVEAVDGQDACGKLRGNHVDLILCDVNMPNMDGLSFLTHPKIRANFKRTPVILLSTESHESKKAEGKAAGARAWITKPFRRSTLLDAVNKLCVPANQAA
ncbi:MAG: hypothetical protein RJA10_4232 [Pseudomonadota bacterium]|jgi:two-component system chemotaxis response regulator CheY